jgi:hypothetical protein
VFEISQDILDQLKEKKQIRKAIFMAFTCAKIYGPSIIYID